MISPAELHWNEYPPMPFAALPLPVEPLDAASEEAQDIPVFLDYGRDI